MWFGWLTVGLVMLLDGVVNSVGLCFIFAFFMI